MIGKILQLVAISLIKLYRVALSPFFGQSCRFMPTCSRYTEDAIRAFGFAKGTWLGIKRVLRCHPWSPGGYDPIPRDGGLGQRQSSPSEVVR